MNGINMAYIKHKTQWNENKNLSNVVYVQLYKILYKKQWETRQSVLGCRRLEQKHPIGIDISCCSWQIANVTRSGDGNLIAVGANKHEMNKNWKLDDFCEGFR